MHNTGERSQECRESVLFFRRKMQRMDLWIEIQICLSAMIVELNYLFNRSQASIVHKWGTPRGFAQRWCFECAPVGFALRDCESSVIAKAVLPCDASVVEALISQICANVACRAVRFAAK